MNTEARDEIAAGFRRHLRFDGILVEGQCHRMIGAGERYAAGAHGLIVGEGLADHIGGGGKEQSGGAEGLQGGTAREATAAWRGTAGIRITVFHGCPLLFWQFCGLCPIRDPPKAPLARR